MPDQDASLPTETGSAIGDVVPGLDGLVLPPAVERSLLKSAGRLIGSITDLGTELIEHVTARVEARTDAVRATAQARRIVKLDMAKLVPGMIAADEALATRAVAYLGHEMIAEQANRERVLEHAVEDLRSAPPQEDSGREIDDDWLHAFMKEASIKSAPEMQLLFGRILSGEIKRPGTFSLKAVRVLGMMSQATAQQFETLCNLSIAVFNATKVISYSGDASHNSMVEHGLSFDVLNNLNENDLVYGDFNIRHDWKFLAEDRLPFGYAGNTVWLETRDAAKLDALSRVQGIMFSEVGNELRQIVSMQLDSSYTSKLIKYFEDCGCDLIKTLARNEDGSLVGKPFRNLGST